MYKEPELKVYKQYPMSKESAWDKKSYDPILYLYLLKTHQPRLLEKYFFDVYFGIKHWLKEFFRFWPRLIQWIPVIWKDRDWDDSYIFDILKLKLLRQRNYLVKNYRHETVPQVNRDITICLNLIERFQFGYYETEYFDYKKEDHYFQEIERELIDDEFVGEKMFTFESTMLEDNLLEYINKYPHDKKSAINEYKDKISGNLTDYIENEDSRQRLALFMSQYRHQKARKLLFKIISDRIEYWWD